MIGSLKNGRQKTKTQTKMTIFEYDRPRAGIFNSFLKLDKKVLNNALIVIMIGVFLLPNKAYLAGIEKERLIELTNAERQAAGLKSLSLNEILDQAAMKKAGAILESQIFDHELNGRRFSSWIKDAGYEYSVVGENLAMDFISDQGVFKAWMDSPSHRRNILNPDYRHIGLAIVEGSFQDQSTIIIVQMFGAPKATETPREESSIESNLFKSGFPAWLAKEIIRSQATALIPKIDREPYGWGWLAAIEMNMRSFF